jgi:hypothetical protein
MSDYQTVLFLGYLRGVSGLHRGNPVDAERWNSRAIAPSDRAFVRTPFPYLVVPGFTPRLFWSSGLHPKAVERLERALIDLREGLAPAVIVTGGAVHSPDNEAVLMRDWLLERGVEAERILVEPHARHSTTNLRNAGRLMLERGARQALVVTSDTPDWRPRRRGWRFAEQSYYLGFPWLSTFHIRCLYELGYTVGELDWLEPHHVRFVPSPSVLRPGRRET